MGSNPTPSAHISENCALNCGLPRTLPGDADCVVCGHVRAAAATCGWLCPIRAQVCGRGELSAGMGTLRCRMTSARLRLLLVACGRPHRIFDPAFGFVVLAGDAFGIDPQQHVHAVPRPLGDLRSRNSGIEPG